LEIFQHSSFVNPIAGWILLRREEAGLQISWKFWRPVKEFGSLGKLGKTIEGLVAM
jgi:hypothetical protein